MSQADADGRAERASPAGDAPPTTGQVPFDHQLRFGEMTTPDADLEESQARSVEANAILLRSILEAMPEASVVIDISGEILLFSKAAEAMFGFSASEVVGQNVSPLQVEQLQRELAHIGRAHEMGTLASTIAHELNQPLMAVANIVQTAAELLKRGDPAMREPIIKALDDAGQETLRAGEILRRLRDFLSRGELEKTFEDACKLAEDAISFESALARYRNIHCTIECASDLTPILVDRVQIQQVILNLVKNAVQSIGKNGTVRIAITPANTMVRFTVSDTGPGVPPARIGRLFDPFSTTKTEGMGLGLPICRSIIEAHGGMIWYETAPGGGAAFIFTIRKFHEESDDAQ